jgi:processing peptidase subunit beta
VTVISETSNLPGTVTFGLCLKLGTRDENQKTSGALHSIQTTYYKSFTNTNETINFGMVQMSGGKYSMNFDRENTIFKASCLAHDTVDIFSMLVDCALEPRNFNSANVAMHKTKLSHSL